MKKILLCITIIFGMNTYAQQNEYCWNEINTITTNWNDPQSSNTFDWTQKFFEMYIYDPNTPEQVVSPFYIPINTFDNLNLFPFQNATIQEKDFYPEDGWELVIRNFGVQGIANDRPFYALYNKYTGKLRAFLLIPDPPSSLDGKNIIMRVSFADNDRIPTPQSETRRTALFQHMKPIGKAVENFDPSLYADITNAYINENYYWFFAEFQTAYDPCTCVDLGSGTPSSTMTFTYSITKEAEIEASISGEISDGVASNTQPTTNGNPTYSLNSFSDAIGIYDDIIKAGQKGYKDWGKYQKTANDVLNFLATKKYRDKLYKSIDTVQETIKIDLLTPDLAGLTDEQMELIYHGQGNEIEVERLLINKEENFFISKNYSIIKSIASTIPYVGVVSGLVDHFTDGGTSGGSSALQGPTVFDVNLTLSGTLKSETAIASRSFKTPGSEDGTNPNGLPDYNNILGVFNLLELPDAEFFDIPVVDVKEVNGCGSQNTQLNDPYYPIKGFSMYRPKENIKYVVNPASNLEVRSVEAAIVLDYHPLELNSGVFSSPYQSLIGEGIGVAQNQNDILVAQGQSGDGLKLYERIIDNVENSTNLVLEMATNYDYSNALEYEDPFVRFRTDYLPVTCFSDHFFTVVKQNEFTSKCYIKLYVVLDHKTDPNFEPVTMILTYDWTEKIKNATKNENYEGSCVRPARTGLDYFIDGTVGCNTNIVDVNEFLYSVSTSINNHWNYPINYIYQGETNLRVARNLIIPNGAIIPPNAVIEAGGVITIEPNVNAGVNSTIISGAYVDVQAPNNIVNNNVQIISKDRLEILYNCTNFEYSELHNTDQEILNFCQREKYKNIAIASINTNNGGIYNNIDEPDYNFTVFPNPTKDILNIEIKGDAGVDVSLKIIDLSGRIMQEQLINQEHTTLEVNNLSAGAYIIEINGTNGKRMQKFIKQ